MGLWRSLLGRQSRLIIRGFHPRRSLSQAIPRTNNTTTTPNPRVGPPLTATEIEDLLSTPTTSPAEDIFASGSPRAEEITPKQLHHLLRLSGLPPPSTHAEETTMLKDLHAQLRFVQQIQQVDTTGIEPLRSLRDETRAAKQEETVGLEAMKEALGREEVVGRFRKRIRRKKTVVGDVVEERAREAERWDVLGQAPKRVGRFFVVESGEG